MQDNELRQEGLRDIITVSSFANFLHPLLNLIFTLSLYADAFNTMAYANVNWRFIVVFKVSSRISPFFTPTTCALTTRIHSVCQLTTRIHSVCQLAHRTLSA
jgi:hypothetical protein